jgi:hypothetical protein
VVEGGALARPRRPRAAAHPTTSDRPPDLDFDPDLDLKHGERRACEASDSSRDAGAG